MKSKHTLISPSNLERRLLCPGSLHAEKNLEQKKSVHSELGTFLHDRINQRILNKDSWSAGLTDDLIELLNSTYDIFLQIKSDKEILFEIHEENFDLSFLSEMKNFEMRGTVDSVFFCRNENNFELHIIDFKFGRGVQINAYYNYQLMSYALAVLNDAQMLSNIKETVHDFNLDKIHETITLHLHIVQPYMTSNNWELTVDELQDLLTGSIISNIKNGVELAYQQNAPRIPSKKACQFCLAKATCSELAVIVPSLKQVQTKDKIVSELQSMSDEAIANIYEKKDLILMYLNSIEEYIRDKLETGQFLDYILIPKFSSRKWIDDAENTLKELLQEKAYETTTKLITITKAEKLLGKEKIKSLVTKEITDKKIVKNNNLILEGFNDV